MPTVEPIVSLEERVHRLLSLVKRLRQDNARLQERVRQVGQQLAKREMQAGRWTRDRIRVEAKIRKLLTNLDAHPKTHNNRD